MDEVSKSSSDNCTQCAIEFKCTSENENGIGNRSNSPKTEKDKEVQPPLSATSAAEAICSTQHLTQENSVTRKFSESNDIYADFCTSKELGVAYQGTTIMDSRQRDEQGKELLPVTLTSSDGITAKDIGSQEKLEFEGRGEQSQELASNKVAESDEFGNSIVVEDCTPVYNVLEKLYRENKIGRAEYVSLCHVER